MRLYLIAATMALIAPASGQNIDSMTLASELGTVIAAEQFCGLSYDQAAVATFIEDNVAADDLGFPSMLNTMVQGSSYQQDDMSTSAKTAHCTQVARLAKTHGFTK